MERPWVVCGFVVVGGGWIRVDVDRRAQRRRRVVVVGSAVGRILGQVAEVALRSRLQQCDEVKARVDAELGHILAGSVPYVLISGKKWRSPLRLTCQSLQMQVSRVDIDTDALLRRRLIVLKRPVRGNAKIVFNGADFGNFLVHPLLRSAPLPNNTSFDFLNRPAKIHKGVSFSGKLRGTSTIFHFQLLKSSTDNTTPLVIPSCKGKPLVTELPHFKTRSVDQPPSGSEKERNQRIVIFASLCVCV